MPLSGFAHGARVQQAPETKSPNRPVICKVMEAFEDGRMGVRAIIFHQRDKADGARLKSLLLADSGKEVELQTTNGQRYHVIVFRVKACFGRGLVLVPAGKIKLNEHDEFTLLPPPQD